MNALRKIFIVVAGGNPAADQHFEDTIKKKRKVNEVKTFLPESEIKNLEEIYHGTDFIVWGAVPGPMNVPRWESMAPGDIVLIYSKERIRFVGEIAAKVRNKNLARYFWKETEGGQTWELMYFIVNETKVDVPLEKINPLFGYQEKYRPRGFTKIDDKLATNFMKHYGDIYGVLKTIEKGENICSIPPQHEVDISVVGEQIDTSPTEHTEMQWRLIRLGMLAKCNVWVPTNDQHREYKGNQFSEFVMREFHEALDVPPSIKNVDVVWKFGPYSIKSAFEIENTTSVYSGILRLSDLRAGNPNSSYPLFIVAPEEKKKKFFNELHRPTFSGPCLRLNEVIKFLGYKKIREIDESFKNSNDFDPNLLFGEGESVPINVR